MASARAGASIGPKAFIDENEQAPDRRSPRHRNRRPGCQRCGRHERAAADDVRRDPGPLPPRIFQHPDDQPIRAALSRARRRMAQFAAADRVGAARQGRPHRFLDLHLHQLAAHAALCPRLGREISRPGTGGDRRPRAGVRLRKRPEQRPLRPWQTCGFPTRSRSTTTMSYGAPSGTSIGRRCISSMRRGVSGIIISARADTSSRK